MAANRIDQHKNPRFTYPSPYTEPEQPPETDDELCQRRNREILIQMVQWGGVTVIGLWTLIRFLSAG